MVKKAVQIRPNDGTGPDGIGEFLENLLGHPVPCAYSIPPIYFFKATEKQLETVKEKYGKVATITSRDAED